MPRVAVICGTGMSSFPETLASFCSSESEVIHIDTPWGQVPVSLLSTDYGEIVVIDRHHSDGTNRTPPHMIEHRANVHSADSVNPDLIISINSVGTMVDELPPGKVGLAGDILDLTTSPWSFHDLDAKHSDRSLMFDSHSSSICADVLTIEQGSVPNMLVVAQCVGPQFESPSEIDALEKLGAQVVGMTLGPEQRLISELDTPHISLVCSSNWAAGRNPENPKSTIDHEGVSTKASETKKIVSKCIIELLSRMDQ